MKLIEIRNTRQGEVAYLFDESRGKVMKVFVDDYTAPDSEPAPAQYEDEPAPAPQRRRVAPVPMPSVDEGLTVEDLEGLPDMPAPAPVRRVPVNGRQKSIIPPHLAGVFKQPGTAGAAEEVRQT